MKEDKKIDDSLPIILSQDAFLDIRNTGNAIVLVLAVADRAGYFQNAHDTTISEIGKRGIALTRRIDNQERYILDVSTRFLNTHSLFEDARIMIFGQHDWYFFAFLGLVAAENSLKEEIPSQTAPSRGKSRSLTLLSPKFVTYTELLMMNNAVAVVPSFHTGFLQEVQES